MCEIIPHCLWLNDSEKKRFADLIRAVKFCEALDAGASFVSRSWIALWLGRSEDFVKHNWNKSLEDCEAKFAGGRSEVLSQASKDIQGSCHWKKSCTQLSQEIQQHWEKTRQVLGRPVCNRGAIPRTLVQWNVVRSRQIILINEEINEANWMVSNSAKLDCRTKQHTQFGVSASNGSRDMARTKSWRKKQKIKTKKITKRIEW